LICFFPNTLATSALMESMGYVPNYEMIVPVSTFKSYHLVLFCFVLFC